MSKLDGIDVTTFGDTETILEEAARLVDGPRQQAYGYPIVDFTRTGRIWGAMLGIPDVLPRTVALMMVAVKLSREMNLPSRDNLVDIAGYARTAEMVTDAEES